MTRTHATIAAAALAALVPAVSWSAPTPAVGPINSVLLINTHVPGAAAGVSVGNNLTRGVIGNDAGGVASVGAVSGVSGATNALFGKTTQASTYGVALAPQLTFSANPALYGGVDQFGDGVLTAAVSSVQSAVVNSTAVAQANTPIPAALSTGNWGTAFDSTRITAGGSVFVVGRDAANSGNLIMGRYTGYASNGSGGTWAKALKAGDTILNPDATTAGTLAGGTAASTTFDASALKVTDVGATPTYITRAVLVTGGTVTANNNDVVIANGTIVSGGGNTLREGSAVSGLTGTTFSSFSAFDIASNGNTAVGGNTTGTTTTSFVAVNGAVVAEGGDTFAGVSLATTTGLTQAVDVNESGDYAFIYGSGTGNGRYIFFGSEFGTALVAQQTVTQVGVDTDGDGAVNVTGALDTLTATTTNLYMSPRYLVGGSYYVDIYFGGNGTNGTAATGNAIFKTTVLVPEPASLALLAGAATLLRRRRNPVVRGA